MFIDEVKFNISSGKGGDGNCSFWREAKVDHGGPDGGDGGQGGDIVFTASANLSTLQHLRHTRFLKAGDGERGGTNNRTGASGEDCLVEVPLGTTIKDETGVVKADLVRDGERAVILSGGRGGKGNARFASATNRAPRHHELGEPGAQMDVLLELKLLADVGFVGLPSVGKSTLLARISNARPKTAEYHFTTLEPNLGVVDRGKEKSWVAADLPGLIEGASEGKGLGHRFLRHVERTRVLVHLIDIHSLDPVEEMRTIETELNAYSPQLFKRPRVLAVNKIDTLDEETAREVIQHIKQVTGYEQIFPISAVSGKGIEPLLYRVDDLLQHIPREAEPVEKTIARREYRYRPEFTVEMIEEGRYRISGEEIERRAAMTSPAEEESLQRFWKMLEHRGAADALRKKGVQEGDVVEVGPHTWEFRE